ncbi:hypothetical protein SKAU_G00111070 [Synaphobranchus kaupii]|uniref:Reverse transcriptase n=1 Tax=Synaphobranchus kaupii TaxID=118154 RepID=A0A9Q1G078_SYNKA|nr:hypothetical protein SKAU_G00111070 [Synaphobranchus kaupii]
MKDLYATTKKLSGKMSKAERPVKVKYGKPIIDIQQADRDLPIDCSVPTKEEIRKAIKKLRNGKAAGPNGIPAEALKADMETMEEMLHPLFKKIWEEDHTPSEWKEGYLIKLPKKGDLSYCSNCRGITLLSIPGKVFNRIILDRVKDVIDPQL